MIGIFTCKDCKLRHPGCHDKCEKYQTERKAYEEAKEQKRRSILCGLGWIINGSTLLEEPCGSIILVVKLPAPEPCGINAASHSNSKI